MLCSVLLVLAQLGSSSAASSDEVIVIGRRAEEELAACLSRNCPPSEDIELSLQASVDQFADGRYDDARRNLQRAIRRNRDQAAALPGPVSSLYATLATVAQHEGDSRLWLSSARNNVQVLRSHLGDTHSVTLLQELSFGDNLVRLLTPDSAETAYKAVQHKAVQSGDSDLAASAAFRRAWLALMLERDREAERLADEAVAISGADNRLMTEMREILRTRIAVRNGDDGAIDALAAQLRQSAIEEPRLLFEPEQDPMSGPLLPQIGSWSESGVRIADVGYWIRPDGRTAGAEMLRDSGMGQWGPVVLRQLSGRRYIPLDLEPGHPGVYRIDRFTVRGTIDMPTGSRIARRMGDLTLHVIDLTETDAMSDAHRQSNRPALPGPG